jgi:hypothetical protein
MPDVGMPLPRPDSHTSTHQWQSFEVRMRSRRAERCVLRAETALEAGLEEEARSALAEARTLNPDTPDIESLRSAVLARRAIAIGAAKRTRVLRVTAAATSAAIVIAAAIAMWPASREGTSPTATTTAAAASAPPVTPPVAPPSAEPAAAPPPAAPAVPEVTAAVSTTGDTRDEGAKPLNNSEADRSPDPLPVLQPVSTTPAVTAPPLPPVEKADPNVKLSPSTTDASSIPLAAAADGLAKDLPVAELPSPRTPPPPPPDPATLDEPQVRALLARFEAAYSSLSAQAAQAVWPSVNERVLAQAFDSLESQQVSLGRCSVAINGATAVAECSGPTSWTPKVGGGRRTASRRWRFDLSKLDGAWRIDNAEAR